MADAVRSQLIEVSAAQATAFRLRRHRLDEYADRPAVEVARAVFGLHAQVQSCAELMWSARSASAARAEIDKLLYQERALVKAWFMRGTLHLLPAADLKLHGAARGLDVHAPHWFKYFQITPAEFEALMEVVPSVLGAEPMTRKELAAAVAGRLPDHVVAGLTQSWGALLKPLARRGQLCFGPPRGGETTLVLPSAWLGEVPDWEPDDAAAELARRYLRAFGPATRGDFVRWAGIEPTRGRVAWTRLAAELAEVSVEGVRCWVLAADLDDLSRAAASVSVVRLLGGFDTLLLGHDDRTHLGVPAALREKVWRKAGWISPVLLVNGRVAGVWSHAGNGRAVTITVEPFGRVDAHARQAVAEEAERVAGFVGGQLRLQWAG